MRPGGVDYFNELWNQRIATRNTTMAKQRPTPETNVTLPGDAPQPIPEDAPAAESSAPPVVGSTSEEQHHGQATTDVAPDDECPFVEATVIRQRLKMFIWGKHGVGKTTLGLSFPKPVVLDIGERGTVAYGGEIDFSVKHADTSIEAEDAVLWLLTHKHSFKTLVIDPITNYRAMLIRDRQEERATEIAREKKYVGPITAAMIDNYQMTIADWGKVKRRFTTFVNNLVMLDMNIIATARSKTLTKQQKIDGKWETVITGYAPDSDKDTEYMFDIVFHLVRTAPTVAEDARYVCENEKARGFFGRLLPKRPFTTSYDTFLECIGAEILDRDAVPVEMITDEQETEINGMIAVLNLPEKGVATRLAAYGARSVGTLQRVHADKIIKSLAGAVEKMAA